jgi:hypothetical protein
VLVVAGRPSRVGRGPTVNWVRAARLAVTSYRALSVVGEHVPLSKGECMRRAELNGRGLRIRRGQSPGACLWKSRHDRQQQLAAALQRQQESGLADAPMEPTSLRKRAGQPVATALRDETARFPRTRVAWRKRELQGFDPVGTGPPQQGWANSLG